MAEEIRNKFVTWTLNVTSSASSRKQPSLQQQRGVGQQRRRGGGGGSGGDGGGGGGTASGREGGGASFGQVCGVGVNLALSSRVGGGGNVVVIDSVVPNGPACRAGLMRGDAIRRVDDTTFLDDRSPDEQGRRRRPDVDVVPDDVAFAIRGDAGTEVTLVVERTDGNDDGNDRRGRLIELVLVRELIGMATTIPHASSSSTTTTTTRDQEARGDGRFAFVARGGASAVVVSAADGCSFREEEGGGEEEEEEEEERKEENDMSSSAESADRFDDDAAATLAPPVASSSPSANIASKEGEEEKAIDECDDDVAIDNDGTSSSVACSVDDASSQQWEMLSERSGSAIVVSFSGSYCGSMSSYHRSTSPSVLRNKFVLVESTGESYIHHVVLPTDTLQGLCLAYKISATRLRMENNFSGNSLHMAPKRLRIPTNASSSAVGSAAYERVGTMMRVQDRTSREYKLYAFVADVPSMELVEAKAYLDLSNWDLDEAIRSAKEDEGWDLRGGYEPHCVANATSNITTGGCGGGDDAIAMYAVTKPKALTARDIYNCPPPFDGHGFELKDIKR